MSDDETHALDFELYGEDDRVILDSSDVKGTPLDPVGAYRDWIEASGITTGPLFRGVDRHGNVSDVALSNMSVARIVRRAATAAGLPDGTGLDVLRWRLRRG